MQKDSDRKRKPSSVVARPTMTFVALLSVSIGRTGAADGPAKEVVLPETKVIAVRVPTGATSEYAEAYGKLVGYYAQPGSGVKVIFPQRSVMLGGSGYAAIAIDGPATPPAGIEVIQLPPCRFVSMPYTGGYGGLGLAVQQLVELAQRRKLAIDERCGFRIHHLNSPDNTPVERLEHIVYVPVATAKP